MPKLTVFAANTPAPTYDRPRPERLVAGNPLRTTWEHFLTAIGDLSAGIWACEPGAWNIAFAPGKDEFFCVISGRIRITDNKEKLPNSARAMPVSFRPNSPEPLKCLNRCANTTC